MKQADTILQSLQRKGHKLTKVRKAIIQMLLAGKSPCAAPEILVRLADLGLAVNKTTVYRALLFFKERKIIAELEFGEGKKRYEITPKDHHHHLLCVSCKRIHDAPLHKDLDKQERAIEREYNFTIINHSLEFFGLCAKCQNETS